MVHHWVLESDLINLYGNSSRFHLNAERATENKNVSLVTTLYRFLGEDSERNVFKCVQRTHGKKNITSLYIVQRVLNAKNKKR